MPTSSTTSTSTTTVQLSSSGILSLYSTPVTLLPAPGSGRIHVVLDVEFVFDFVSTQYDGPSQYLSIASGSVGNDQTAWFKLEDTFVYNQIVSDNFSIANRDALINNATSYALSSFENQPVVMGVLSSNPIDGDGTLKVIITYRTIEV